MKQIVNRISGDLAENSVLLVKPIAAVKSNEELAGVGVGGAVASAGDQTPVFEPEAGMELVREDSAVDALATWGGETLVKGKP